MDQNIADHMVRAGAPVTLLRPDRQTAPIIFVSSHSGRDYPADFVAGARLDPISLRLSEDSFVDDLFGAAVVHGAPLLLATFPRAYCDANREKWELDQAMFADILPHWVNTSSARVSAGLGTIARVVASGCPIYRDKLQFTEAEQRIDACWQPFHDQLAALVTETRDRFGCCLLIDCHSMPTPVAGGRSSDPESTFVLGDSFGTACEIELIEAAKQIIRAMGYAVSHNKPYAGGYITKSYGRPSINVNAIQIEIARNSYMNEEHITTSEAYNYSKKNIERFICNMIELSKRYFFETARPRLVVASTV